MAINFDLGNPSESLLRGVQTGLLLRQRRQEEAAREQATEAQARMQADLNAVLSKEIPTARDYAALTVKYPQLNKQFEQAWGMLNDEQRSNRIGQASEVYAALEGGDFTAAKDLLELQARAAENGGDARSARASRVFKDLVERSPETAKTSIALRLSGMMGPDRFTETFTKLENNRRSQALEGADLTTAEAKALKAAVDANFAESQAAADLNKKGWDISKIQNDIAISKENRRIAAMNAQLKKAKNDLAREKLEAEIARSKKQRDETVNEKIANVESARGNIDNMLNTLDLVAQTPIDVIENATGPVDQRLPTVRQSTADFEELINTIDAQAFLAQIPNMKGLGALSDAEGRKLAAALQNFSLRQSPDRLIANVREAQRLLLKGRQNLARRYGVPDTIADTPAVKPSPEEIDAIYTQYKD